MKISILFLLALVNTSFSAPVAMYGNVALSSTGVFRDTHSLSYTAPENSIIKRSMRTGSIDSLVFTKTY